ncbi:globin domain-containing protein [Flavitalea sp. BT771]|uniref:globin domain-containing protein n=1 Tax=Flavitalea sp. BT771 TaxID=3063329 RepID=UPI0026E28E11|nr:globin domain-containing protein [Flavitalea sp. BT771]MDO6434752.1 globin domain-containing protein [Flavitalea sp. BT771]MDV6223652.1 globin domain-containing protein [Flavitalea sp. BT771]
MTPKQVELVRSSWLKVAAIDPDIVGTLFYNRLFETAPGVRRMFHRPVPEQSRKLLTILDHVIEKLDVMEEIVENIVKLAQRHNNYGVRPEHFADVGEALLWTLEKSLGDKWNDELKEAWMLCYVKLSSTMIHAVKHIRSKSF